MTGLEARSARTSTSDAAQQLTVAFGTVPETR